MIQFAAPGLQQLTLMNESTRSESVFFQTYYDITDKLRFQLGGRFTSETTEMRVDILTLIHADGIAKFFGGTSLLNGLADVHAHGQRTWNNGGGKLGLDYKWTDDVLSYIYYARGFKSGGYVGRGLVLQSDIGPFNPEFVDTVELGLKSDWLDHKLRVNAAAFYNKYHNLQIAEIYFTKDAAGNTVELVGSHSLVVDGSEISHGRSPLG